MQIDFRVIIVVCAMLIFYLRLIWLQRERNRRLERSKPVGKQQKRKDQDRIEHAQKFYSIISENPRDRLIGCLGATGIVAGTILASGYLPWAWMQSWWWLPLSIGMVAFSWLFKL